MYPLQGGQILGGKKAELSRVCTMFPQTHWSGELLSRLAESWTSSPHPLAHEVSRILLAMSEISLLSLSLFETKYRNT